MRTGAPVAIDLFAAMPISTDIAPAHESAMWFSGSGMARPPNSLSCRRSSPPPWPPAAFRMS